MRRSRGIRMGLAAVIVAGAVLVALVAGAAQAKPLVVLPRPGQVGVSGSWMYGTLLNNGNVGDQFGGGTGLGLRLRYRMRFERGFGLTFETHGMDVRAGVDPQTNYWDGTKLRADSSDAYRKADVFLYGVDFYQMFGTRTKMTKLLSVGAGLAHPVFELNSDEQQFPFNDGAYLSAGAGIERFFWRSIAFDLGARYQAVFIGGKLNHDLQASAGLIFYASL